MDRMDEAAFRRYIEELCDNYRQSYSKRQLTTICKEIYDRYHPTHEECQEMISQLRRASKWLPQLSEMVAVIQAIRKGGGKGTLHVPCKDCGGLGVVWARWHRFVVPCTCENRPVWMKDRETWRELSKRDDISLDMFERHDGRRLHEQNGQTQERLREAIGELFEAGKWLPRWLRDKLVGENVEPPTGPEAVEQVEDAPF